MIKYTKLVIAVLLLQGCVSAKETDAILKSLYNVASTGSSQFDGSKYIRVNNILCSNTVVFELYQDSSQFNKGIVLLRAGTPSITNIGNGESLFIKLDGKVYTFESADSLTEHSSLKVGYGIPFSYKTYLVPNIFVRKVASSDVFLSKITLLNNTFVEGKCSALTLQESIEQGKKYGSQITQDTVDIANKVSAINGFKEFIRMMDSTIW